jgi:hypothetical protein
MLLVMSAYDSKSERLTNNLVACILMSLNIFLGP